MRRYYTGLDDRIAAPGDRRHRWEPLDPFTARCDRCRALSRVTLTATARGLRAVVTRHGPAKCPGVKWWGWAKEPAAPWAEQTAEPSAPRGKAVRSDSARGKAVRSDSPAGEGEQ